MQLGRIIDGLHAELTLHQPLCGRNRKTIKLIESTTRTAIYMPPSFSSVFRYCPVNAQARDPNQIFITGEDPAHIELAKKKMHEVLNRLRLFVKEVEIPSEKIDNILLSRMDKVQKITETFGTYISFPPLGSRKTIVRIQGQENLHIERTARELMALVGVSLFVHNFSSSSIFLVSMCKPLTRNHRWDNFTAAFGPSPKPMPASTQPPMTSTPCLATSAPTRMRTYRSKDWLSESPDPMMQSRLPSWYCLRSNLHPSQRTRSRSRLNLRTSTRSLLAERRMERSTRLWDRVSIQTSPAAIRGESLTTSTGSVQIMFEGFGEYNFNIDVNAQSYESMKQGLSLVEQEMPASISFHVPDQYHKRIIGIGGQHIQRIMKKHSVFVKFSNAMDRGSYDKFRIYGRTKLTSAGGLREEDDIRVDNVICRTPARNAQNLELVKSEILEMVDRVVCQILMKVPRSVGHIQTDNSSFAGLGVHLTDSQRRSPLPPSTSHTSW